MAHHLSDLSQIILQKEVLQLVLPFNELIDINGVRLLYYSLVIAIAKLALYLA